MTVIQTKEPPCPPGFAVCSFLWLALPLARDVSLALSPATDSSILNILPGRVSEIRPLNPAQALVCLDLDGTRLLAHITHRSVDALGLAPGTPVYAQIKSVALLV